MDVGSAQRVADRKETFLKAASVSGLDLKQTTPASEELASSPRHTDRIQNYTAQLQSGSDSSLAAGATLFSSSSDVFRAC